MAAVTNSSLWIAPTMLRKVQIAAAAISCIHKNAPVTEFGARVQKRADAKNA
jgi:hypothetical protein